MSQQSDFQKLVESAGGQFKVVYDAPIPFFLVVAVVAFTIWRAMEYIYRARLDTKDELITLRTAQIDDYKLKLDGATPEAARARIDALEARFDEIGPKIDALGPRTLTPDQLEAMSAALAKGRGNHANICHDAASADAARVKVGLVSAFNKAGWVVRTPMVLGLGSPPVSGIGVAVRDVASPTDEEQCVIDAFKSAGIQFDLQPARARLPIDDDTMVEVIVSNPIDD